MNSQTEVSLLRLYLIRALFLLMCVGTVLTQVPGMLHRDPPWSLMHGVGASMLLAMAVLSAVGVRYPLQMLPILLWELFWKSIWLLVFALPLWRAHQMDAETLESVQACLMGVVLCPLVMPWRYVWNHYVRQAGDRWTRVAPTAPH
jgi:hypothetical protein